MKKILIMMLSVVALTACSKDDNNNDTGEEKILGTWFLVEAHNAPGIEINDCTTQSNITFNADNTAISEFHAYSDNNCVSSTDNTTWSKTETKYTFNIPTFGPATGTVTFNGSKFTFVPDVSPTTSIVFEKR
ncbi:hypothetical protein C7S20_11790 [Christiangramia fulva]|uniref:Lipocalin-like domain-containing protein n=1 Tax=Christiangramia fulva TaxID=2126553 RepID=A0A2R3Z6L6_9FLAO|nr:lipocalin family protein [Christiangramia fulva]AVR45878.1 hypothetical protein C7S20_11790 [Christiangramia fulva]